MKTWQTIVKENDLDVSEINLEQVLKLNRLDGEYYKPLYLGYEQQIISKGYKEIQSFASITDGIHSSIDFDEQSTINLLSAMSPKDNYFDISRNKTISETQHKKNPRTELQEGDVIVSTVGTIGNCAVVDKTVLPANSDRHIGIIRVKSDYLPHFLSTFLLTKYGKFQTLREATGNVQLNLFIEKIRTLKIPITSDTFQKAISDVVIKALSLRGKARGGYVEAEQLLLKEINLEGYVPSEENISVRELAECLADNRFDAEYWEPRFDEVLQKIGKSVSLGDIAQIKRGSLISPEFYSEYGVPYIRGADFSSLEIEDGNMTYVSPNFTRNNETIVSVGNILFPLVGSVGKTALVTKPYSGSYISNNLGKIALITQKFLPEYIQALFQSIVGQMQFERLQMQTAQPKISDSDMKKIKIPMLSIQQQKEIAKLMTISRSKKDEAKVLLEKAKQAVEIFIEKDEQEALRYLAS